MSQLGQVVGLSSIPVIIFGLVLGGFKTEDSRKVLLIGLGMFLFGVVAGNGLLD
jgi:hypothetical protein